MKRLVAELIAPVGGKKNGRGCKARIVIALDNLRGIAIGIGHLSTPGSSIGAPPRRPVANR
jgi:hypothetical protein